MKMLTKGQIISMHSMLIQQTGGSEGIRDEGALDSALAAPHQTFAGNSLYPSVKAKIARLCYGLIQNHPFVDGNKRIGMLVLFVSSNLNSMPIETTDQEIVKIGLGIANGTMNCQALTDWLMEK